MQGCKFANWLKAKQLLKIYFPDHLNWIRSGMIRHASSLKEEKGGKENGLLKLTKNPVSAPDTPVEDKDWRWLWWWVKTEIENGYHADIEDSTNDDDDDDVDDDFEDFFEEDTFITGRDLLYCFIRDGRYLFLRGYLCYRRIPLLWRISEVQII